ncbi:GbsR/MarR family transcriptional regulator [Amycolatopsis saalfeldensis]|uniref:MarR family protein n=1 Tax=Amycolatopsis saalfeldensis TaxID=394193 RepID=A0A1H8XFK4_9PSEU|nr:MarR family transcriptional regulator [Amycolatopsis saalfeldensis]SEP38497.1 MarR family protein [Amycolatopsis saalfeldensis]
MVDDQRARDWVEQVSAFFARQEGLPPITGRILGWLMICEPAGQSAADIAAGIKASRASMTTNIRSLTATGLVRRYTRAGDRTAYYQLDDQAWETAIRRRIEGMSAFEDVLQDGLALMGPDTDRASRLRAAQEVYRWVGSLLRDPKPARPGNGGPR